MIKKRERAVFLGNRLKVSYFCTFPVEPESIYIYFFYLQEFSEDYHAKKSLNATVSENLTGSLIGGSSSRTLMRSNSIQDELLTTF